MLAASVPGLAVIVDPDRHGAGLWAERELNPDVFLLDDGFQHMQLARDLDILLIDGTDPFGGAELPPLGRLREPLQGLRRADMVVVTRADRPIDSERIERVVRAVGREGLPIHYAWHEIVMFRSLDGSQHLAPSAFRGRPVLALAALGNPAVFLEDLTNLGLDVCGRMLFRDHHCYSIPDLTTVANRARSAGAECIVTTAKDAVKLSWNCVDGFPVYVAEIEFRSEQEAVIKGQVLRTILRFGR
jgi:tetraacyldisaccharide 4'-kinase